MNCEIALDRAWFTEKEKVVFSAGEFKAVIFKYSSGVEAVRLENSRGHIVVLPYEGQKIWEAVFDKRSIGMSSRFEVPHHADVIVDTYGAFAYHCGALRLGNPLPGDDYVLHGELPCAKYSEASILAGNDGESDWIAVTGLFPYRKGFGDFYNAKPRATLRAGRTTVGIDIEIDNLSPKPMDLMYMCHINFLPVKNGKILQTAGWTPEETLLRRTIPSHVKQSPELLQRMERMGDHPETARILRENDSYDPEAVFFMRKAWELDDGKAWFLQVHPSGFADFVSYSSKILDHHVRWIFIDENTRALGMIPGTCEPDGYRAELEKGNVRILPGEGSASFSMTAGSLDQRETAVVATKIMERSGA